MKWGGGCEMTKVLLINGSPREKGNTYLALDEVAKTLGKQGIETEIAWIGKKPVRSCVACYGCSAKGDGHCVFNDDICNTMIDKLNATDGLVVGTPTYYGVPNGAVLSLLQRMFCAGAQTYGKPAAAVTVCRRGGATSAFQALQMPFQMVNMPLVTSQYWNIVYGREEGQATLDTEGMQTMRTLANNMAWMLKSLDRTQLPKREPWDPMHFIR